MTDKQKARRYERALRWVTALLFPVTDEMHFRMDLPELERRALDAYWTAFHALDPKRAKAARSGK